MGNRVIMIEFLSNSNWINPQIDFLTILQTIRTEHFEFLNKIFLSITILGEIWLPILICSIVYWCVDTKFGIYLFSLFGFQLLTAQLFKMIACVYRPWILSDKVHPVELAITAAKGYSFPSGHSATAASVLGGLAYINKNNKIICAAIISLIFLVGFSRMWLGVHTPQDVVTGLTIGFILVFWMNAAINWAEKNRNRYLFLSLIIDIFAVLALIYICYFNKYPYDYIAGKILVNPQGAIYSSINCFGYAIGLINGAFLCRRLTDFDAKNGSLKSKFIRGITGAILIFLLLKFLGGFIFQNTLDYKLTFLITAFIGFFITFLYPVIISKFNLRV